LSKKGEDDMPTIDASVYVALINTHEADHASSWAWFQEAQAAREPILAPVILLAEVASAISRGIGDSALAHRVVEQLQHSKVIELVPVIPAIAERAAAIAADYQVRGCDAIYLALAEQMDDALVTLDRQQLERGAQVVTTFKPEGLLRLDNL
jgi:predicted nucleic acid-binding protein